MVAISFLTVANVSLITLRFLGSLWLSSTKSISFELLYYLKILSIWAKGIKESFFDAIKTAGHFFILSRPFKFTSSISNPALFYTIGFKYFNATSRTILGIFVFCFPISRNNYFNDWKGLSKTAAKIPSSFSDKYFKAATAPIDLPQSRSFILGFIFFLKCLIMDLISLASWCPK